MSFRFVAQEPSKNLARGRYGQIIPEFHRAGPDFETRSVDLVLEPVHNGEIALVVHTSDVAGVQPAAVHRPGRLIRAVPVSLHHLGPADDQFSGFVRWKVCAGFQVDHPGLCVRQWDADGTGFRAVRGVGVGEGAGFGEPVPFNEYFAAYEIVERGLTRTGRGAALVRHARRDP